MEIIQLVESNKWLSIGAFLLLLELIWIIYLQMALSRFKKKGSSVHLGEEGKRLEEMIYHQSKNIKSLDKEIHELYEISNQINNLAFRGIHKVAMARFNPFNDVGGDQSFSMALLNGKNSGVVISSLYTREGTRVFSKAIVAGKADKHPLTEEEIQVVKSAMDSEIRKV